VGNMEIENLSKSLKIKDESLKTCLNSIKQNVSRLWEDGLILRHYTKHGIEHSEKIIEYLEKLLEDCPGLLNDYERFVLLASAYLHDIGMQSPRHAGLPKKDEREYTDEELEKIRENHHIASANMIIESASGKLDIPLGLESESCKNFAHVIAEVSKYHRKLDIEKYTKEGKLKETSIASQKIRLPLLAALLRLADALDRDFQRVNMERLKLVDIPVKSKFEWWAHWYCQSVEVEKGIVKLYFRFPQEYKHTKIEEVFKNKVKRAIEDDYNAVYAVLFERYDVRLYKEPKIKDVRYGDEVPPLPHELEEYIHEISRIREREERVREKTGVVFYVDGIAFSEYEEVIRCISNLLAHAEKEEWKACIQIIRDCETLTMSPLDRMILYLNGGNVFYVLGMLNEAKRYYEDALKISERKKIQEIYKDEALRVKGATLGNIGLIYRAKGELDEALKYFQEALKIFMEIKNSQVIRTLINIATIHIERGLPEDGFKYLGMAISGASSPDEFNKAFSALLRTLRNMIMCEDWGKIKTISIICTSRIIKEENIVKFLTAIKDYALWIETSEPKHKRNYDKIKQELPRDFRTLLKDLTEGG